MPGGLTAISEVDTALATILSTFVFSVSQEALAAAEAGRKNSNFHTLQNLS